MRPSLAFTSYATFGKTLVLLLFSVLCGQSLSAQKAFEGIITMACQANGQAFEARWYVQGDKVALELPLEYQGKDHTTRLVPQPSAQQMHITTQTPEGRFINDVPFSDIKPAEGFAPLIIAERKPRGSDNCLVSISGHNGTAFLEADIDACLPINVAPWAAYFRAEYSFAALARLNQTGFPKKAVVKDAQGKELSRFEVTSIKEQPLEAAIFE